MKIFFCNSQESFFLEETVQAYMDAGIAIPSDLFEITPEEHESFMVSPDRKKPHYSVELECMEWIDIPPLTQEEVIAGAEAKKRRLLLDAEKVITPLQDAVDTNDATHDQKKLLLKWKAYRLALSRIDTSLAPNIIWPERPEVTL
ncbi:tail fiber assembly protein [Enterobacter mori]|uniref:tail fiber assembly protein n=1 Tax=Enterobacter mori TaxID=539813 RepID=UPI003B843213